ncbi:NADH-cytochrome b5 reductase [Entophlyctis luteolus]|nr:NADH-cytochrome b5 reductase [Entophlyctis luteolus]KAJ3350013.1 NADH-cytochrome b5 reductase [Entophlyctis luteolus]KAJ3386677.1 NADH-cytochrome b5 reductase [Entophlyctis sp. JEL0112]
MTQVELAVVASVVLGAAIIAVGTYLALPHFRKAPSFLAQQKGEWADLVLTEKIVVSPNTAIYRLALPSKDLVLGLPIGQHIQVTANIDGKDFTRSYTPISSDDNLGLLDLLIKSYPTGNLSRYFAGLKVGDKVRIKGPKGNFKYAVNLVKTLGMIAGGTGITPMLQIITASLKDKSDNTKLNLIFANVTEADILLKDELDILATQHPDRFSVYYVLNNPPSGWTGGVGFVTRDMIEKHAASNPSESKILLCGPPPMIAAMQKFCEDIGFAKPNVVSKTEDEIFKF